MGPEQLADLIHKHLKNNLSVEERERLEGWLKEGDNREHFTRMTDEEYLLQGLTILHEAELSRESDKSHMDWNGASGSARVLPMGFPIWYKVVAAAIILLLFVGGYFYLSHNRTYNKSRTGEQIVARKNVLLPGGNHAILTIAGGGKIVLDNASNGLLTKQGTTSVVKLSDGKLAYNGSTEKASTTEYNTISTPRGGQYQVELPDGTNIWLNSASSLKFPTAFNRKDRSVELEGEAYFEVAQNASMPFYVTANGVRVNVLGTKFNVNAYTDEPNAKITLLQGSVKVQVDQAGSLLKPGQQARVVAGKIDLIKKADLDEAMAWKNGKFHFNNASIETVMRQLSRWYDIEEVRYEGARTANTFTGDIDRDYSISDALKILELSNVHFRIEDKKIMVLP